ncbi:MAG: acetate--CoA ligase family protein, partial [Vicinamibacterales bacterium]|nr:acetate--CoA ligase family protein [Vicinamibacterales bacterium]
MSHDRAAVKAVLEGARAAGRASLTSTESKQICDAYGIPVPREGLATSSAEAATLAADIGYPVVLKIVSKDILHKTEAGGVLTGLGTADEVARGYEAIVKSARAYKADADIAGVQVQQMLPAAQEVIVGAVTDPSFGKLVAFGLGGVLVEVLKDVTFRLAPASRDDALSMIDGIQAAEVLKGVRGADPVNRDALASLIENVSALTADFPEIHELDLNPVLATKDAVAAVDVRILLAQELPEPRPRPSQEEILKSMVRIMRPKSVAVIGASGEDGKIGNSVMKNLINGG